MNLQVGRGIEVVELRHLAGLRPRVPLVQDAAGGQEKREVGGQAFIRREILPRPQASLTRRGGEDTVDITPIVVGTLERRSWPKLRPEFAKHLVVQPGLIVGSAGGGAGELVEDVFGRLKLHPLSKPHRRRHFAHPPPVRPRIARRRDDLLHQ